MINWLNVNQGFVMSILTLVYVIATILILRANSKSVTEMKMAREEESRPYVVVYLEFDKEVRGVINLIVQNLGKTMARNVRIMSTPDIEKPVGNPLSETALLKNVIPNIPPGYKITAFVDVVYSFTDSDDKMPTFSFDVEYFGNNTRYNEEYVSDLSIESELHYIGIKSQHDFFNQFESFSKDYLRALDKINTTLERISQSKE